MTVRLRPAVEFEFDSERRTFEECLTEIKDACNDMPECDGCPWKYFCDKHFQQEESLADFISAFKSMLLDYECVNDVPEDEEGY